jgi:hypothetical protein
VTVAQADRQQSARDIAGTATTDSGDWMAAMATELEAAEITVPADFNGRLVAWLQLRTGESTDNLPGLMAAFAADQGATNFSSVGSFDPIEE